MTLTLFITMCVMANNATASTVEQLIRDRFGNNPRALRIARCESHLYPRALGRAGERGVWQLHPSWFGRTIRTTAGRIHVQAERLWDPVYNTRVAWILSSGGRDWSHWTCARWN